MYKMSRAITVDAAPTNLNSVVMNASGAIQYIASTSGGILKSTNYGVDFTNITTSTAYASTVFTRLQTSADGVTLIGLTNAGELVRSVNGGASFSTLSGIGGGAFAMCFNDPDKIVVFANVEGGWSGYFTTNGGSSWTFLDWSGVFEATLSATVVQDVEITANGTACFVSLFDGGSKGSPGAILKFVFSSQTWSISASASGSLSAVNGFMDMAVSIDGTTIVAMAFMGGGGTPGNIAYSTNSGSTWSLISVPDPDPLSPPGSTLDPMSVAMSLGGQHWFVPSGGRVYYTENAGSSWTISDLGPMSVGNTGYYYTAASANGDYVSVGGAYAMYHFNAPVSPPVPCFPAGTRIATLDGYKPVETIESGDKVLTADGRVVTVKRFATHVASADKESAPYLVPANTFGPANPSRDLRLSPWHAFQIADGMWQKPAIASLYFKQIIQYDLGKEMTYYHFEAPNYLRDNFIVDGTIVESYAADQLKGANPYTYHKKAAYFTREAPVATKHAAAH